MANIFISYRRADSEGFAGRLYDKLALVFGEGKIFMDIDNMPFGANFVEVIQRAIARCNVCLVLIGKGWLESSDQDGKRRIDNPADFVRLEVESALKSDTLVVPILLQGVAMPTPDQLPSSIGDLSYLNALKVGERFHPEVDRLVAQLRQDIKLLRKRNASVDQAAEPQSEVSLGTQATSSRYPHSKEREDSIRSVDEGPLATESVSPRAGSRTSSPEGMRPLQPRKNSAAMAARHVATSKRHGAIGGYRITRLALIGLSAAIATTGFSMAGRGDSIVASLLMLGVAFLVGIFAFRMEGRS